jgi:hypothetical protein
VYFAHYLCIVYLPAVSPASPAKEALHTGAPNPRTLSLQCIPMRPLHPTRGHHPPLGCRTGSPFRCTPARCVASGARSGWHSPAPTLRCSLARPLCGLRCSLARPALAYPTPTLTLARPTPGRRPPLIYWRPEMSVRRGMARRHRWRSTAPGETGSARWERKTDDLPKGRGSAGARRRHLKRRG